VLWIRITFIADPDPVPDLAYHFDVDPDFYLMRIPVTKVMRIQIHADPDPQHWYLVW
jgi:hypothetical protein